MEIVDAQVHVNRLITDWRGTDTDNVLLAATTAMDAVGADVVLEQAAVNPFTADDAATIGVCIGLSPPHAWTLLHQLTASVEAYVRELDIADSVQIRISAVAKSASGWNYSCNMAVHRRSPHAACRQIEYVRGA